MPYALAIFDLDGTLADSVPWFQGHVNAVADRFRFRRVGPDDVDHLRQLGPREVLGHLDVPLWKVPLIARHMRRLKSKHLHEIPLFPGVGDMLSMLSSGGVKLALVSSDWESNARRQLGPDNEALISHFDCGSSLFGKAKKFRNLLARTGVAPDEAIAIGDEVRDVEAAQAAGIVSGAVTWGYAREGALRAAGAQLLFANLAEIPAALIAKQVVATRA